MQSVRSRSQIVYPAITMVAFALALCGWTAATKEPPTSTVQLDIPDAVKLQPETTAERIVLANGVTIQLLRDGDQFLGLGRITIDGVQVRSGQTPLRTYVIERKVYPKQLIGVDAPPMHERTVLERVMLDDDGLGARIVTRLKASDFPDDRMVWFIRGHTDQWRGRRANGFSYAFSFIGKSRKIHQIREEGSWLIGDSIRGALLIDQNESYGRQSWAMVAGEGAEIAGWSFPAQRQTPEGRLSVGDMIDFISLKNVSLVRYLDKPSLTYKELSLGQNDRELRAREWYPTVATMRFETTPMHVRLLHCGGVNAWIDARDTVRARYVEQSGIEPTPCLPGIINGEAAMTTAAFGKEYEALSDPTAYVAWLDSQGIRRTWTWCRWKTAWTMWDQLSEQEKAEVGAGLSHAVMELTWDDRVVDLTKFKRFVEESNKSEIDSMLWIPGGHLSAVSPLRHRYPQWPVRDWSGNPFKYVYKDIAGNFYPAGYGDYLIERLKEARTEIPFTGIWLDSFQVFGLDVIDYGRDGWPNQFQAAADFVAKARRLGLAVGVETNFPLALRASTSIYRVAEIDGREFLAYRTSQHFGGESNDVTPERYFRLTAWMGPPLLRDKYWKDTPGFSQLGAYVNKAYNSLLKRMHYPRALEDGAGVLWYDDDDRPAALFAFVDTEISTAELGKDVIDAVTGEAAAVQNGQVAIRAYRAYRLR